jgi:menaquinone-dependent protoporphyrinogen oxidase
LRGTIGVEVQNAIFLKELIVNSNPPQKMNRRKFLKLTGATLGVSAVSCCGLGTLATTQPQVNFVEEHIKGENQMNQRILVTYASKAGSTGEVAAAIGKSLATNGTAVDVLPIENVANIHNYQAVVVGSAIRAGKWIASAADFIKTHQSYLSQTPTAYFTCCMTLHEDTEGNQQKALDFMAPACNIVPPVDMAAFAGKMDYSKISFFDRLIITKVFNIPEGDFRNWTAIQAWANKLQPKLIGAI